VLLLGRRPTYVADALGRTARMEESTSPVHEVVRLTQPGRSCCLTAYTASLASASTQRSQYGQRANFPPSAMRPSLGRDCAA
jgi:hypothetical protein